MNKKDSILKVRYKIQVKSFCKNKSYKETIISFKLCNIVYF